MDLTDASRSSRPRSTTSSLLMHVLTVPELMRLVLDDLRAIDILALHSAIPTEGPAYATLAAYIHVREPQLRVFGGTIFPHAREDGVGFVYLERVVKLVVAVTSGDLTKSDVAGPIQRPCVYGEDVAARLVEVSRQRRLKDHGFVRVDQLAEHDSSSDAGPVVWQPHEWPRGSDGCVKLTVDLVDACTLQALDPHVHVSIDDERDFMWFRPKPCHRDMYGVLLRCRIGSDWLRRRDARSRRAVCFRVTLTTMDCHSDHLLTCHSGTGMSVYMRAFSAPVLMRRSRKRISRQNEALLLSMKEPTASVATTRATQT